MSNPTTIANQLLQSWKDREYREQFVRERVQSSVALQLRALREQRQMTQTEMSERVGKAQPWISLVENPNYGKWTVATLLDFAIAFDTDLEIKFRPFSKALHELSRQTQEYFRVSSFEEELPKLEADSAHRWTPEEGKWSDLTRAIALLNPYRVVAASQATVNLTESNNANASGGSAQLLRMQSVGQQQPYIEPLIVIVDSKKVRTSRSPRKKRRASLMLFKKSA